MRTRNPHFKVAVTELQSGRVTNSELARRYGVTPATISQWAKSIGLSPRRRGRRPMERPNAKHCEIIELAGVWNGSAIARHFGVSRQRVHQILKRWSHPRRVGIRIPDHTHSSTRSEPRRDLRERIICFRLTSRQLERAIELLSDLGFHTRMSNNAACRALLLSALDAWPLESKNDASQEKRET
jgi:transposase-like protein